MEFLSSDECCFKGINSIMYSIYSAYLRMYVHVHMICVYIYIYHVYHCIVPIYMLYFRKVS